MELGDFVKKVIQDVESALKDASMENDKHYTVDKDGIDFDVAVTASDSMTESVDGKIGASIKVFGANVGGQKQTRKDSSEVSRVHFKIYIPPQTKQQSDAFIAQINEHNRINSEKTFY